MSKLVPAACILEYDDNSYSSTAASYTLNPTTLASSTAITDVTPYLSMELLNSKFSFRMGPPLTNPASLASLTHLATMKNLGTVDAWVALHIRDTANGQHFIGKWWKITTGGAYYNITETWLTNPLNGGAWTADAITSERIRFGVSRVIDYAGVKLSRMYIEPNY